MPPTCQTSPNRSSLNCLLHIDGRLWATQFGRQRPHRPTSSNSNPEITSDHRIFSGHQNVVIKMSHHMVPRTTFKHTKSKLYPNCKGKRYYGASPILKHTPDKLEALSLWRILDEPLGQQLQPLIRFNTPMTAFPCHPPHFWEASKVATREMESLYRSLVGPTIVTKEHTRFDIECPMLATDSNNFEQIWTPSIDSTEV